MVGDGVVCLSSKRRDGFCGNRSGLGTYVWIVYVKLSTNEEGMCLCNMV
jgi:hypothetical protein